MGYLVFSLLAPITPRNLLLLDFLDKVVVSFTLQEATMSKTVLQIRVGQALKQVQANTSVVVTAEQSAVY